MNFIHLNGVLIHYRFILHNSFEKRERTIVFINSLGTDFRIWDGIVEVLKEFGNILLLDNRGHGLSGVGHNTNGLSDFANDVLDLMENLQIQRCILVGLSVGGMIAQIIADRKPEIVEKLVLCDTRHKIGNTQIWDERISEVREKGLEGISSEVMQHWFNEQFRMQESSKVSGYKIMLERTPVLGYIKTCEAIRDADLTGIVKNIDIPSLCIVGSDDKSTTPDGVKQMADLMKNAYYEVIQGSGHLPCIDNPGALSKLLIEFLM